MASSIASPSSEIDYSTYRILKMTATNSHYEYLPLIVLPSARQNDARTLWSSLIKSVSSPVPQTFFSVNMSLYMATHFSIVPSSLSEQQGPRRRCITLISKKTFAQDHYQATYLLHNSQENQVQGSHCSKVHTFKIFIHTGFMCSLLGLPVSECPEVIHI